MGQSVIVALMLEKASATLRIVGTAMLSTQVAHAQRYGVDVLVVCVLNASLLSTHVGGLQFLLQYAFVALKCLPRCAVCGKVFFLLEGFSWTWQVQSWFLLARLWEHLGRHMRKGEGVDMWQAVPFAPSACLCDT